MNEQPIPTEIKNFDVTQLPAYPTEQVNPAILNAFVIFAAERLKEKIEAGETTQEDHWITFLSERSKNPNAELCLTWLEQTDPDLYRHCVEISYIYYASRSFDEYEKKLRSYMENILGHALWLIRQSAPADVQTASQYGNNVFN